VPDPDRRNSGTGHPIWLYLGIVALALAFGLPLCRRAIILSDEGYLLQQSLDLLEGRVLYRDMDAFITPGMWFLLAGTFALFGPSVLASRALILVAYVALALVGFRIVAGMAGRAWGLTAVLALLLFSVWAFPAWTLAFYSPVSILFALAALERLLAWQRNLRPQNLAWVGFLLGLSILFKQNYGVFASIAAALGYLAARLDETGITKGPLREFPREIGWLAAGGLAAGLPFLAYLIASGTFLDAWTSLVVHPFEFGGRHDIPYAPLSDLWLPNLYQNFVEKLTYLSYAFLQTPPILWLHPARIVHRMHALLYWIAPMIFASGMILALLSGRARGKRIDAPLFSVIAFGGLIFLGVFPRADFNHLVNVYQPVLLAGVLSIWRGLALIPSQRIAIRRGLVIVAIALPLAYASVAIYWYAMLVERLDTPIDEARGGVLVSAREAAEIGYQLQTIHSKTRDGEALLTLPDLAMLNFLAERPVPSAWYNLYEHHIAADEGLGVARSTEAKGVNLAIARYNNFFSDRVGLLDYAPALAHYLITHFERRFVGGKENYIVYERREEILSEQPFENALESCTTEEDLVEIRHHLLFSALYHKSRPDEPMPPTGLGTRCRIQVPAGGGILALEVGYRRPHGTHPGTTLEISIDLVDGGTRQRLLAETLPVVRGGNSPRQQAFKRFEIDLENWSGRAVELLFTTRLEGAVLRHPMEFREFAMIYRDVRIQQGAGGARP
jgi:hypothetical protein